MPTGKWKEPFFDKNLILSFTIGVESIFQYLKIEGLNMNIRVILTLYFILFGVPLHAEQTLLEETEVQALVVIVNNTDYVILTDVTVNSSKTISPKVPGHSRVNAYLSTRRDQKTKYMFGFTVNVDNRHQVVAACDLYTEQDEPLSTINWGKRKDDNDIFLTINSIESDTKQLVKIIFSLSIYTPRNDFENKELNTLFSFEVRKSCTLQPADLSSNSSGSFHLNTSLI